MLQIILYTYNFKREDNFCGNNFKRTRKETFPALCKEYPDMFIKELKGNSQANPVSRPKFETTALADDLDATYTQN